MLTSQVCYISFIKYHYKANIYIIIANTIAKYVWYVQIYKYMNLQCGTQVCDLNLSKESGIQGSIQN